MSINGAGGGLTLSQRVAEEIRSWMGRRRISGAHLARQLGVSSAWISYRLTGTQPIDLNDLEKIAVVLGVDVTDLLPRTVVSTATPVRQTTVPESGLPVRLHPFSRPSHQIPASSTRRTARLSLAHA